MDARSAKSARPAGKILYDLLRILPLLPRLQEVELGHADAGWIVECESEGSKCSSAPPPTAFNHLAAKIQRLRLLHLPPRCLASMIRRFSDLKELIIEGYTTFSDAEEDEDDHRRFQNALLQLRGLVKLEVAVLSTEGGPLRMEHAWKSKWASMETLFYFSCTSPKVTPELINFIGRLAPNLVSLKLNYEHFEKALSRLSNLPDFPHIIDLDLDGGVPYTYAILSAFASAPLRHLSVGLSATLPKDIDEGDALITALYQYVLPHLLPSGDLYQLLHRRICPVRTLLSFKFSENLGCDVRLPPSISVHVAQMAKDFGIVAAPTSQWNEPRLRNAFNGEGVDEHRDSWEPHEDEEEEIESGIWVKDVRDTLAYGERLREECERTKDRAKLKELIELVRPLNARREVALD